jgi:serine/threonine protein phosphatase PrpC
MRPVAGVSSSVGLVRSANEDSFLVREGLYVVCDGMGGARAGEVASEMACRGLSEIDPAKHGRDDLSRAVTDVNKVIADRSMSEHGLQGMGTTLTGGLIKDDALTLIHVGDSRAYLMHDDKLSQLTEDHSWVAEMMRRGELTAEQAAVHPHRSIITRALGTDYDVEPDIVEARVEVGDRLLLCSDGLSGMISDERMAEILRQGEGPQKTAAALVDAAVAAGGEDNVTVIVVEFKPDDWQPEEDGLESGQIIVGPPDRRKNSSFLVKPSQLKALRPAAALRRRLGNSEAPFVESDTGAAAAVAATEGDSPSHWYRRRRVSITVLVVVVLAIAVGCFALFNSTVYYVGASNGVVVLYQGLPSGVGSLRFSHQVEQSTVKYDSLPADVRTKIDAHDLVTKEEGQMFLRSLSTTS